MKTLAILLLEDSPDDAFLLERHLHAGFPGLTLEFERVETAVGFEGALDRRRWDLILADFALSGYDGLSALETVQERQLDVPFIIVSGKIGEDAAAEAMRAGAHDYVMKSNLSRLNAAIERELREASSRHERTQEQGRLKLQAAALAAASNSIVITSPSGEIEWVNDGFVALTGYTHEEAIGKTPSLLASGEQDAEFYRELWETVSRGDTWHGELVNRRKDGSLFTTTETISPIKNESGTVEHFLAIQEDVSSEREAQRLLAQRTLDLERSNRDLEEFAYVASHDLAAPLHVVGGYVELLARRYRGQLDADADDFVDGALRGLTRMQRLIDDLLGYSRAGREPLSLETLDTTEIANDVIQSLTAKIEAANAAVTVGALPDVEADRTHLTQIFQNLLANALKFTDEERPPVIAISAHETDRDCCFAFTDNGPGIDEGHDDEVFRMFGRLDGAKHEGSGIGLAICKRLVERHEGSLWFEPAPGHGTTFHVDLPKAHR
jgi:PAS domain S-box-containing protein